MAHRSWGTVSAGVFFERRLLFEKEPKREQREGKMMVPSYVGTDLILIHANVAFGELKKFLDCVSTCGGADNLSEGNSNRCVTQALPVLVGRADQNEGFHPRSLFAVARGYNPMTSGLDGERLLFTVADVKCAPDLRWQR
jgi:hypothetical protein